MAGTEEDHAKSDIDTLERELYKLEPAERLCRLQFLKDGILLPHGHSRNKFKIPNPTFFRNTTGWHIVSSANPLHGWPWTDVLGTSTGLATNDLYGKLYYYIRDVLRTFCRKIRNRRTAVGPITFNLFQLDAARPGEYSKYAPPNTFNRIEVSNLADEEYLGLPTTLKIFDPMLRSPMTNAYATFVFLLKNKVGNIYDDLDGEQKRSADHGEVNRLAMYAGQEYAVIHYHMVDTKDPNIVRLTCGRSLIRDVERFAVPEIEKELRDASATAGARFKILNTLVQKWPQRLKLRLGENGFKEEFERAVAGGHNGEYCYFECQRARNN